MSQHLVCGAGPIGSAVALQLAATNETVTVVSRSGRGPVHANITLVTADVTDAATVNKLATGKATIFNCLNPTYTRWAQDWPLMAAALLNGARHGGAVYAICSNLYGYGQVTGPMTTDLPLAATGSKGQIRANMWLEAAQAHERGEIRAVEVRGSDYIGAGAESHLGQRTMPNIIRGKAVRVMGNPDMAHSWTFTQDMARTLIAAANNPAAWGKPWHAVTNPAMSQRQALGELAALAQAPTPRIKGIPYFAVATLGLASPLVRELKETYHQFDRDFILDDSETRQVLGIEPTCWLDVLVDHLSQFDTTAMSNSAMPV